MCKGHAGWAAVVGFIVLGQGTAIADAPKDAPPPASSSSQPLNLRHTQLGSHGFAADARARMQTGDCAGALDLFDQALRTSTEPTLYRDRGLCHEQLDQPYPAIEDYRHYLTAAPDAADADGVRERLDLLEGKIGGHTHSADEDDSPFAAPAPVAPPPRLADRHPAAVTGPSGQPSTPMASYEEDDDEELRNSLRDGKGWSLAPFFAAHKWFLDRTSFGDNDTWAECVGIQVRYAHSRRGAFFLELGYEHFNSTSEDVAVVAGLTSLLGYEIRFPLDPRNDNQFFLLPGVGYEQLEISPTDPNQPSASEGAVTGRVRFGYRRLIGNATAFEASLDGGAAEFYLFDGSGTSTSSGLAGLNLALAWGL